jgi:hypothetical protein
MLEFSDLEARPSHTAQPDYFLALDAGAKACFGLIEGRGDGLSFIGKGGPESRPPGMRWPRSLVAIAPQLSLLELAHRSAAIQSSPAGEAVVRAVARGSSGQSGYRSRESAVLGRPARGRPDDPAARPRSRRDRSARH